MIIQDGAGTGRSARVTEDNRLQVMSNVANRIYFNSRDEQESFSITCADSGPVAAEYTLYIQNNDSSNDMVIDEFWTWATDADVVWKLSHVTGTSATAALITPVNCNLASAKLAPATVRGGAGGVTGLTPVNVIWQWHNGAVNSTIPILSYGVLRLGPGQAIAFEYDAGTGGAVLIGVTFYIDHVQ